MRSGRVTLAIGLANVCAALYIVTRPNASTSTCLVVFLSISMILTALCIEIVF